MTDDKGAGEEIYKHSTYCHATYEFSKCLGCAFAAGRKAEREITARLLMYARHRDSCGDMDAHNHDKFPSCNCGLDELKDAIRGGNDAK
jgi:hypothetical protein